MNHNLLNRYLYHQRKTFDTCYPQIQDVTDDEAIHDIRVSIKKVRTLLLLIDFIFPGEWDIKKRYKPYRAIFKKLGTIRDLQVQQKIAVHLQNKTGKNLEGYLQYLQEREINTRKLVHDWLQHRPHPNWEFLEDEIRGYYHKTGKSDIIRKANEYIRHKVQEAKDLTNRTDRETIHHVRRLLKQARYMMDMMSAVIRDKSPYKQHQIRIKPIEDYLGDWHDRMVALDHVFMFEKEMYLFFPRSQINIKPAIKILMNESDKLVKKAVREINKLDISHI